MSLAIKLIAGVLVLIALGLPVLETWEAILLAIAVLALAFSESRPGWRRVGVAVIIVAAVATIKTALPRADIAEGHNAFLVIHEDEALQRGLPAEVFRNWKAQFDTLYPPDPEPYDPSRSQWRPSGVPLALFTTSTDAIWRRPKYTRQVDAIAFDTLGEFRGGFANEPQYNFWHGELLREWMPFYAMYELTTASVGSALVWRGQVFWERADGGFEEILHPDVTSRRIGPEDVGKRVYAAFFPKRDPLHFRFAPSVWLRLSAWFETLVSVGGVFAVLFLTIRPRWVSYVRALALFSAGYVFMMAFIAVSAGKYLGKTYPPQGGGDDGLVHDGWGRMMALLAGDGHIGEALRGFEDVYWFTPGSRYVRMAEKLLFGDTNLLYALLVPCVTIAIFYLVRHVAGSRWAWVTTAIFCVLPAGNLSFLQYIANAKLGYGEATAGGFFMLGLTLLLRSQPAWGGTERNLMALAVGGAALAASMFIRPNFAIAVIWLAAAYAWAALRARDAAVVAVLALGLAFALWMPFHNWYYGGEFYLISKSGTSFALPLRPGDYVTAVSDMLDGRADTKAASLTAQQLKGWLWDPGFLVRPALRPVAWALHGVKLLALIVTCWVAIRWVLGRFADGPALGVVAIAALCAHAPMLFAYTSNYRYAMLAWDLSLIALIGWAAHVGRERARRNRDGVATDTQSKTNDHFAVGHPA